MIESSEEEGVVPPPKLLRRKSSGARRKSDADKGPSRPSSRTSRRRADSTATVGASEKEREKEKDKDKSSNRISVAGWASSALDSVMSGRGKKDKENFATLEDGEGGANGEGKTSPTRPVPIRRLSSKSQPGSKKNTPSSSPSTTFKSLKALTGMSSDAPPKMVRAVSDFSGSSSDELSFKTGEEIVLLNEVIEGWWMGELRGKKGLFPTAHTEPIQHSTGHSHNHHPSSPAKLRRLPSWRRGSAGPTSDEEDMSKTTLVNPDVTDSDAFSHLMTSDDDDHPFSDTNYLASRSAITPSYPSSYPGHRPPDSATEDETENENDDDNPLLKNDSYVDVVQSIKDGQQQPPLVRKPSFGRKPPPPPPPPRRILAPGLAPPPIPHRNRAGSAVSSLNSNSAGSSPFDSPMRSTFSVNNAGVSTNPFDKK